jgi:hypothetical protein
MWAVPRAESSVASTVAVTVVERDVAQVGSKVDGTAYVSVGSTVDASAAAMGIDWADNLVAVLESGRVVTLDCVMVASLVFYSAA